MVSTYGDGDFGTVHVHNAEKLSLVDFNTSYEYLAKDAVRMSKEYDNGASGDFAHKMADNARLVEEGRRNVLHGIRPSLIREIAEQSVIFSAHQPCGELPHLVASVVFLTP